MTEVRCDRNCANSDEDGLCSCEDIELLFGECVMYTADETD